MKHVNNQKIMWERIFQDRPFRLGISDFAKECVKYFLEESKVLELGCGLGRDTIFFSEKGHKATGIDFSKEAIKNAKENERRLGIGDVEFLNQDISKELKFKDSSFDAVYARLALHYFTDEVAENIFQEIKRVLKPNGILCACCKSTKDPLYGRGEKIEKDMYSLDGHIRYFFSEEYFKEKLKGSFRIKKLWSGRTKFYDKESAFVKVIAERIP